MIGGNIPRNELTALLFRKAMINDENYTTVPAIGASGQKELFESLDFRLGGWKDHSSYSYCLAVLPIVVAWAFTRYAVSSDDSSLHQVMDSEITGRGSPDFRNIRLFFVFLKKLYEVDETDQKRRGYHSFPSRTSSRQIISLEPDLNYRTFSKANIPPVWKLNSHLYQYIRSPIYANSNVLDLAKSAKINLRNSSSITNMHKENWFQWPSTLAPSGRNEVVSPMKPDGVLAACGYRVGQFGAPEHQRRKKLDEIFLLPLPTSLPSVVTEDWYEPHSPQRLRKIANTIASLVRNAKRRKTADMERAITEWHQDLDYMKKRYYIGLFKFEWPVY